MPPDAGRDGAPARRPSLDGGFPYLVAERDGAVLGYAYAGPYRPRPAYRSTVEDSIYVAPDGPGPGRRHGAPARPDRGLRGAAISA